jgi:hypothetical protein
MAYPAPAAPAIPLDEICESLAHNCLALRDARLLRDDSNFQALTFRSHQIFYVRFWAEQELNVTVTTGSLQRSFNCSRSRVNAALENGLDPPKQRGRHLVFSPDLEADILA